MKLTTEEYAEFQKHWDLVTEGLKAGLEYEDLEGSYDLLINILGRKAAKHIECCQATKDLNLFYLGVPRIGETFKPYWGIHLSSEATASFYRNISKRGESLEYPRPTVCPFCATPLPEMKPMDVPVPLCRHDGYYCETCGERAHSCYCLPPPAAWEPV